MRPGDVVSASKVLGVGNGSVFDAAGEFVFTIAPSEFVLVVAVDTQVNTERWCISDQFSGWSKL